VEDWEGHKTTYQYDVGNRPRRYDCLSIDRENILHTLDVAGQLQKTPAVVTRSFTYARYTAATSAVSADANHSTHRLESVTDEEARTWRYGYDDQGSHSPLLSTLETSPLLIQTNRSFTSRGELKDLTDAEGNTHLFSYNPRGQLETYTDPNGLQTSCPA
jgi:YD repeat-containing protein